jgi:hypothetical protein
MRPGVMVALGAFASGGRIGVNYQQTSLAKTEHPCYDMSDKLFTPTQALLYQTNVLY